NAKYNPFGDVSAAEFRFPYPDSSFDFAFATSLFTHLVRDEARHYLEETARVLRPGGSCLLTFFLLSAEAEREMEAGRAAFRFEHEIDGAVTTDPRLPEEAVAYRVDDVRAMLAGAGLELREPIHFGGWANAPGAPTLQDVVIARRR
ncbi:MAG TPA: class I SAM-dependent methyltransferase, partial [Solirubrobacterales bacterium]